MITPIARFLLARFVAVFVTTIGVVVGVSSLIIAAPWATNKGR
ncbi:MAG TPA: hypothetical protein VEL12_06945 [Candidatus Nitrosopolaris sp.]|nr:hypothetical protein [Candidatus Nitrosopolaris sp.]